MKLAMFVLFGVLLSQPSYKYNAIVYEMKGGYITLSQGQNSQDRKILVVIPTEWSRFTSIKVKDSVWYNDHAHMVYRNSEQKEE